MLFHGIHTFKIVSSYETNIKSALAHWANRLPVGFNELKDIQPHKVFLHVWGFQ
jgi:hypothetical protein